MAKRDRFFEAIQALQAAALREATREPAHAQTKLPVLSDALIRGYFHAGSLEAGRIYEMRGRVQDLTFSADGRTITATTIGTAPDPYRQHIQLQPTAYDGLRIVGRCTCPVSHMCKHVAAVLIAAHHQQRAASGQTAEPVKSVARSMPTEAPLPHQITGWLSALESAEDTESEEYPPTIRNRLLYVLDAEPSARGVPRLRIQPVSCLLRKDGSMGSTKPYAIHQIRTPARYLRPSDKLILSRLDRRSNVNSAATVEEDPLDTLRRILATGRTHWSSPYGPSVSEGPARPGRIEWRIDADGSQHTEMELEPGLIALRTPSAWYADPQTGVIGPVTLDLVAPLANSLLSAPSIPAEMVPKVREELARRMPAQSVPPPREMAPPIVVEETVRPRLRLMDGTLPGDPAHGRGSAKATGGGLYSVPVARLTFGYGPVVVPFTQKSVPKLTARDGVLYDTVRNLAEEARIVDRLARLGFGRISQLIHTYYPHAHTDDFALLEGEAGTDWMDVVLEDVPKLRAEGWDVEIDENFPFQIVRPDSDLNAELREGSGIDWLELHLGVMVDGEHVDLVPALIRLISRPGAADELENSTNPLLIPLSNGKRLALPLDRVRPTLMALLELFESGGIDPTGDKIGFTRLDAADLSRLEESTGVVWQGGEALRALGKQLREAGDTIPTATVPKTFQGALRGYQADGVNWLQFLRGAELGGILADDMGLGKTVQALAHLAIEQAEGRLDRPALIVCPTSLIPNWTLEAERFAPSLKVLALHGPSRKEHFGAIATADLVLTTYPLLSRDHEVLTAQEWHIVILDEAQTIKNPNAETTRQALRLVARQRLCLSGTPLQNHLGELWSLFDFLAPGFLGSQRGFRMRYRSPIEKNGDVDRQDSLNRRVRPFLLRRTKEEVVKELPPKTEILESVEMESGQRAIYEAIRLAMHTRVKAAIAQKGLSRSGIVILDALLKMRQACCDPRLLKMQTVAKTKAGSAKLDRLMELLTTLRAEGRRVLLFSQFTEMLALIERRFWEDKIDYVMLTGDTKDRATPVKKFQAGEVPVFLISLKAGGVGLNLTAADTVIHYDPWWNPAAEDQATDRAHRIGQTKRVFVHRLVTLGTIEEKMVTLKEKKRALVASVLEADHGGALKMTESDVEALFGAGA